VPLLEISEYAQALAPRGSLLGLDPGEKRIGAAVSDPDRRVSVALATVLRRAFAATAEEIFALYDSRRCVGLVVGLPLTMDGRAGPAAQAARAFARNLIGVRDQPVLLWDERLSTAAVERAQIAADASRAKRAKLVDQLAAAYTLQGALDALNAPPRR
jgi:putative Holliday junction resolvase